MKGELVKRLIGEDVTAVSPFILLCISGFFAIFSTTISKSPVLPLFAAHLGADPSGVGAVAAVSAFTGIVASIPAGILSDRLGRRKMLILSSIVFSTAPFLYLFVTEIWHLAVIRFYHGIATAIFIPVSMAFVSDLFQRERGEKMGWFSTSTLLGRFLAPLIGGTIIGMLVFNPELGFRFVYLVCGIAGVVVLFLTLRLSPSNGQRSLRNLHETFNDFKKVLANRTIVITALVEASILFAYGTFETFLPLYAMNNGLNATEIGLCLSSQVITLAITKPLMGRLSDRYGRRGQISGGSITGALVIAGFSISSSFLPFLALSILFGLSLSVVTSATGAFIADLSRKETYGSAMGILGSVMDTGHTTGPLVSGIIASYLGFGKAFIGAGVVILTFALFFFIYAIKKSVV
ncbi:MAG: MFS transporter [Thermodesulfovibrionales bacterium]